nr:hypothetical protein [uncultured Halomonas sp.]
MGNYNYRAPLSDPDIPDTLTKEQVMMLLDSVIKEAFFEQKPAAFCDSILRMNRQLRQRKASALQV